MEWTYEKKCMLLKGTEHATNVARDLHPSEVEIDHMTPHVSSKTKRRLIA